MTHDRISVNSRCSPSQTLEEDLEMWDRLDIDHVALSSRKLGSEKWDKVPALLNGMRISSIHADRHTLHQAIDLAAAVGAGSVYMVTGGASPKEGWEKADAAFSEFIRPYLDVARDAGVSLALESTSPLRAPHSFLFTYRDSVDLARANGMSTILDFTGTWYERDLEAAVRDSLDILTLVQVCDYALETVQTGDLCVLGEGGLPLEKLLSMLVRAGYEGPFDVELSGPNLEAEGYESAIRRSVNNLNELLARVGA